MIDDAYVDSRALAFAQALLPNEHYEKFCRMSMVSAKSLAEDGADLPGCMMLCLDGIGQSLDNLKGSVAMAVKEDAGISDEDWLRSAVKTVVRPARLIVCVSIVDIAMVASRDALPTEDEALCVLTASLDKRCASQSVQIIREENGDFKKFACELENTHQDCTNLLQVSELFWRINAEEHAKVAATVRRSNPK